MTNEELNRKLETDSPGRLVFWGTEEAKLFTREVEESFRGVLSRNFIRDDRDGMAGFVAASLDGRPWWDTMWTRDAGVFLRELALWGYYEHGCLAAQALMKLVQKNKEGYYTYPTYFTYEELIQRSCWRRTVDIDPNEDTRRTGSEMDGTSAIVIGLVLLWGRLGEDSEVKKQIYDFIAGSASPVAYIQRILETQPLIAGSGEFGGGCGIDGEYLNVVQNNLARLALIATAGMLRSTGFPAKADRLMQAAEGLAENMLRYLTDGDGTWIWCIDPTTYKPNPDVLNHPVNRGASFINGVLSMCADVSGLDTQAYGGALLEVCKNSFAKLAADPFRREQFEKYGGWAQFDHFFNKMLTGPSYGHGYGVQCMLLLDKLAMADHALRFLANDTYMPDASYKLHRESPYHFYERYYSPDMSGKVDFDEGCGELNLVCVAEPLKIARMIAAADDSRDDVLIFMPKLPPSWQGFRMENWPVRVEGAVIRCNASIERLADKAVFRFATCNGAIIPHLRLHAGAQVLDFQQLATVEADVQL